MYEPNAFKQTNKQTNSKHKTTHQRLKKFLAASITFIFIFSNAIWPTQVPAQMIPKTLLNLPVPGTMVLPTPGFNPATINGMVINTEDALKLDFILDPGDSKISNPLLIEESSRMVRYFLSALTIPDEKRWVNLSPYEKDRIIADGFDKTEMGRDLLAQDYLLKQLMASLTYPETELGKKYWDRVYSEAQKRLGTAALPFGTFHKVWIVPDKAVVYEHNNTAYIVESHLKVMLEADYLAMEKNSKDAIKGVENLDAQTKILNEIQSQAVRELLLPTIEKEVNFGQTFANLRQIYKAMILASWYKRNVLGGLLNRDYVDQAKTRGVDLKDKSENYQIYAQYVEALQKGVFNYIRKDYDTAAQKIIPRQYFSGGIAAQVIPSQDQYMLSPQAQKDLMMSTSNNQVMAVSMMLALPPLIANESFPNDFALDTKGKLGMEIKWRAQESEPVEEKPGKQWPPGPEEWTDNIVEIDEDLPDTGWKNHWIPTRVPEQEDLSLFPSTDALAAQNPLGGIDFNSSYLDLRTQHGQEGFIQMKPSSRAIQNIRLEGIVPLIQNILSVNVPLLLGLVDDPKQGTLVGHSLDPADHRQGELEELIKN